MSVSLQNLTAAGALGSPITNVFQAPIVSLRAPTANDKAAIGTMWVNRATQDYYVLTSVIANVATWATAGNGNGIFASVEVLAGGDLTIDGGNLQMINGDILITAGDIALLDGSIGTADGNITTAVGNIATTVGNITTAQGDFVAANGAITASGNIASTTGAVGFLDPAGALLLDTLKIQVGAGAPANPSAQAIGDMYIRTDAVSAVTRLYIATAVGTWTNVTCAA